MGHRVGDNAGVLALGEALGWPFEIKRFAYKRYESVVNLPWLATLAGVVLGESSPLRPPWPELVVTAGRRNEPIARWIRKQSGGTARLVHMGRPWAALESWDLVITTPQYRLPDRPNVLHNQTPLHRVTPERLAQEAARWAPRIGLLPRPHLAVLAGGQSGPYPFDAASGARLAREACEIARRRGGSLLITTSARTPRATGDALFAAVAASGVPSYGYRWTPDIESNPYYGLLGLADEIVVTDDSVSMMTEACATRKPVYLYDTAPGRFGMHDDRAPAAHRATQRRWLDRAHWKAFVYRHAMRLGPQRWTRDIRIVHASLLASGRVAWLGEGTPNSDAAPLDDVPRAVARVREMLDAAEPRALRKAEHSVAPA
jgi:mitochondrial fission protein ELM1